MKTITVRMTDIEVEILEQTVALKHYLSASDVMRAALLLFAEAKGLKPAARDELLRQRKQKPARKRKGITDPRPRRPRKRRGEQ